jgi:hypothetical protein
VSNATSPVAPVTSLNTALSIIIEKIRVIFKNGVKICFKPFVKSFSNEMRFQYMGLLISAGADK